MKKLLEAWQAGEVVPPVAQLLGARLVEHGDGAARIVMEAKASHHNAMGTLHGGILCDLADMAMGAALATVMDAGQSFTTLNLTANYLRPVIEGELTAVATVVRKGRRTALVSCRIDHDGQQVVDLDTNCVVLDGRDEA